MLGEWNNMGWLAVFGPWIIMTSLFMIIAPLFMVDTDGDGSNRFEADEDDGKGKNGMMIVWVSFVASIGAPSFFMFTQLFTWGESNLSDSSLMYMTPEETSLYFMYVSWWAIMLYPFALVHATFFSPIYFMQLIM